MNLPILNNDRFKSIFISLQNKQPSQQDKNNFNNISGISLVNPTINKPITNNYLNRRNEIKNNKSKIPTITNQRNTYFPVNTGDSLNTNQNNNQILNSSNNLNTVFNTNNTVFEPINSFTNNQFITNVTDNKISYMKDTSSNQYDDLFKKNSQNPNTPNI